MRDSVATQGRALGNRNTWACGRLFLGNSRKRGCWQPSASCRTALALRKRELPCAVRRSKLSTYSSPACGCPARRKPVRTCPRYHQRSLASEETLRVAFEFRLRSPTIARTCGEVTVHRPPGTGSFFGSPGVLLRVRPRPKNVPVPLRPKGTVPRERLLRRGFHIVREEARRHGSPAIPEAGVSNE